LLPIEFSSDVLLFAGCFVVALGISAALTPLVARWARAHRMVALPRQDRWHNQPTALLGGIAIYIASTVVILGFAHYNTRVLGIVAGVAAALGPVVGGLLATALSGTHAVLACAGGIAAVAVVATLSPTLRSFPRQPVVAGSPGSEPEEVAETTSVRSSDHQNVPEKGD